MKPNVSFKLTSVSFSQLRRLLLNLHFREMWNERGWCFEHRKSGTIFVFRPYALDEKIHLADLVGTRTQLDWRGLLSEDAFDDSLAKTPA